jgi:hypothetical protein
MEGKTVNLWSMGSTFSALNNGYIHLPFFYELSGSLRSKRTAQSLINRVTKSLIGRRG